MVVSETQITIGLATVVLFGVGSIWIALRFKFPSLLLLLPAGLVAGGGLDLVKPEELFGETLFPGVTLLVGLLLFQSGLQLRIRDLPIEARGAVFRMVTAGAAVTFVGGALAVWIIYSPGTDMAILAGAILVVSGPTVVGPLLQVVRPQEPAGSILRWESTVLDPLGAILGVVTLNLILASERAGLHPVFQMGWRLAAGAVVGAVAGLVLVFVMSRFLVTDNMEAAVALLFATVAFAAAEMMASEAGLFATVVLGMIAANQNLVPTARISGFGETLEVLIIGSLFIVLGALVDLGDLASGGWRVAALVAILVVIVRPFAAGISMVKSRLVPVRERMFLACLAPRGIVAVSTAAAFTGPLGEAGFAADFLLPMVFGVILGTGVIYGLSAGPVAEALGVRKPSAKGVAVVGNDQWLADLAGCLDAQSVPTMVITSSPLVRLEDSELEIVTASLRGTESDLRGKMDEVGVAEAIVCLEPGLSENLVTALLIERLGRRNVYRVAHGSETALERTMEKAAGTQAFGQDVSSDDVKRKVQSGLVLRVLGSHEIEDALVVVAVNPDGRANLNPYSQTPEPNDVQIGFPAS
jgi:NhaP-type Na+/H+ or K+/H+ antiporter